MSTDMWNLATNIYIAGNFPQAQAYLCNHCQITNNFQWKVFWGQEVLGAREKQQHLVRLWAWKPCQFILELGELLSNLVSYWAKLPPHSCYYDYSCLENYFPVSQK